MKGDKVMEENMLSTDALQQPDESEEPIELTELFVQKKKAVTFGDIILFQAILCVIAAILFVVLNIFNNELACEIYEFYSEKSSAAGNIEETFEMLHNMLKAVPIS